MRASLRRHRDDNTVDQLVVALIARTAVEEFLNNQRFAGRFRARP